MFLQQNYIQSFKNILIQLFLYLFSFCNTFSFNKPNNIFLVMDFAICCIWIIALRESNLNMEFNLRELINKVEFSLFLIN